MSEKKLIQLWYSGEFSATTKRWIPANPAPTLADDSRLYCSGGIISTGCSQFSGMTRMTSMSAGFSTHGMMKLPSTIKAMPIWRVCNRLAYSFKFSKRRNRYDDLGILPKRLPISSKSISCIPGERMPCCAMTDILRGSVASETPLQMPDASRYTSHREILAKHGKMARRQQEPPPTGHDTLAQGKRYSAPPWVTEIQYNEPPGKGKRVRRK